MLDAAVEAFGRIDCAFNNAGIAPINVGNNTKRTHQLVRGRPSTA